MRGYWIKISIAALVIFGIGYGIVSGVRHMKSRIMSNKDLTIPLGSFIGFNLDGQKVGSIRSLTIRRSAPKLVTGFEVRVRLSDTTVFARLESCRVSVNDADHIDERTSFFCLASDSGYQPFGELRAELRDGDNNRTLVIPLLLPDATVRDLQREGQDSASRAGADSIAAEMAGRVRVQSRNYEDSVSAARADSQSAKYKRRADSLRARTAARSGPPAVAPKP